MVCKNLVKDEDEYSIQCQWCGAWEHGKCANISVDECSILGKSGIRLVFLCATCAPKLDEALEYYDENQNNSTNALPEQHHQLESKLAIVESKLHEIKEELTNQLSKCREVLSTSEANPAKSSSGPAIIANTVYTAINEERDREK